MPKTCLRTLIIASVIRFPFAVLAAPLPGYTATTTPSRVSCRILPEATDLAMGDTLVLSLEGEAENVFVHLVVKGNDPEKLSDSLGIRYADSEGTVRIRLYEDHPQVTRICVVSGEQAFGKYDLGSGNGFATIKTAELIRKSSEEEDETPVAIPETLQKLRGDIGSGAEWQSAWISLSEPREFEEGEKLYLKLSGDIHQVYIRMLPAGADPGNPKEAVGIFPVNSQYEVTAFLPRRYENIKTISVHGGTSPFGLSGFEEGNGSPEIETIGLLERGNSDGYERIEGEAGKSSEWLSGWIDFNTPVRFNRGDLIRLEIGGEAAEVFVRLVPAGTGPGEIGIPMGAYKVDRERHVDIEVDKDIMDIQQISVQGGHNAWGLYDMKAYNGAAQLLGVQVKRR